MAMKWAQKQTGFTIVELLIVVVVIAILAAVTIVAYNGITTETKISIAKSDLRNIANQMELFKVKNGRYPLASQVPKDDIATVLKESNLYKSTRADQEKWDAGVYPEKRFVFCSPNNDPKRFAVVAYDPLRMMTPAGQPLVSGTAYAVDESGVLKGFEFSPVAGSTAASLCTLSVGMEPSVWESTSSAIWSNNAPESWAQ